MLLFKINGHGIFFEVLGFGFCPGLTGIYRLCIFPVSQGPLVTTVKTLSLIAAFHLLPFVASLMN